MLRDADKLLGPAVAETIARLDLKPEHAAAATLAETYAQLIDDSGEDNPKVYAWAVRWVGPLLLDCLESLGATPQARARLKGGPQPDAAPSRLQTLRQAHRA